MSNSASNPALISSVPELEDFLSSILPSDTIYVDLEGNRLSRHGTISLVTLLIHPSIVVRIIDILALGSTAFTTPSKSGKSLKSMLEDSSIPKCIWDVRNDADALWALYRVSIAGVTDIQLLENASRPSDKTYVRGLDKCVQHDLKLGFMELNRWIRTKKEVQGLMPYGVFTARPLDAKIIQYCANDVTYLPGLHTFYVNRIKGDWLTKAIEESAKRVVEAQSPTYDPQAPSKKVGPWGLGGEMRRTTMDEMLDELDNQRMDAMARDMFGDADEVGYYEYDDDGGGTNAADGAFCPEAFDSCWDRNS